MNTKKVEKISEYEQRLLSLKIQATFRRIKAVNVTINLIKRITLLNHHVKCYMREMQL